MGPRFVFLLHATPNHIRSGLALPPRAGNWHADMIQVAN